jgi:hypothetical protein
MGGRVFLIEDLILTIQSLKLIQIHAKNGWITTRPVMVCYNLSAAKAFDLETILGNYIFLFS